VEADTHVQSEINVEISWIGSGPVAVKVGNEFCGFAVG
jgi:hypothetical protein